MGSRDTHRKTNLFDAVRGDLAAKQKAHEEATAPEREAQEKQAAADASLYGGPGWSTLSDVRRQRASQYAAQQAQGGADDAA